MPTIIHSGGSPFAGPGQDVIAELEKALQEYALDRTFEEFGNFASLHGTDTHFFGNFKNLSHVFRIDSDDPAIVERLTLLIRANQQRADYLSQPLPSEVRKEREERQRRIVQLNYERRRKGWIA